MKRRLFLACIVSMILMAGCGNTVEETSSSGQPSASTISSYAADEHEEEEAEQLICMVHGNAAQGEEGLLVPGDGLMMIFDEGLQEMIPVCTVPGCSHAPYRYVDNPDPDCPAAILYKESDNGNVGYSGDYLWYVRREGTGESGAVGSVRITDRAGNSARTIATIPFEFLAGDGFLLTDRHMYLFSAETIWEENLENRTCLRLIAVDLESEEVQIIKEIPNAFPLSWKFLGFSDSALYYVHEADPIDPELAVYRWDSLTETEEKLDWVHDGMSSFVQQDDRIYFETETEEGYSLDYYDLSEKTEVNVLSGWNNRFAYQVFSTGIQFSEITGAAYWLEEGTEPKLLREDPSHEWSILGETENGYLLLQRKEEEGGYEKLDGETVASIQEELAFVSKDGYQNGEEPIILTNNLRPLG